MVPLAEKHSLTLPIFTVTLFLSKDSTVWGYSYIRVCCQKEAVWPELFACWPLLNITDIDMVNRPRLPVFMPTASS